MSRAAHIKPEERLKAIELRAEGLTLTEIAKKLRRSYTAISAICKKADAASLEDQQEAGRVRDGYRSLTTADRAQIVPRLGDLLLSILRREAPEAPTPLAQYANTVRTLLEAFVKADSHFAEAGTDSGELGQFLEHLGRREEEDARAVA